MPTILDCTVEEYHSRPELSSTQLRTFIISGPYAFYHKHIAKTVPDPESDARELGTAFHLAMEFPDTWRSKVVCGPTEVPHNFQQLTDAEYKKHAEELKDGGRPGYMKLSLTYKRHRAYVSQMRESAKASGAVYVDAEAYAGMDGMIQSVHDNPACMQFVLRGRREVPATVLDEASGLNLRALADILLDDEIITDFKTTRFMTKAEFVGDAFRKGYVYQAAFYRRVFGTKRHIIIAVRNEPPFESMAYEVGQAALDAADASNLEHMRRLYECLDTGSWHTEGWGVLNSLEMT